MPTKVLLTGTCIKVSQFRQIWNRSLRYCNGISVSHSASGCVTQVPQYQTSVEAYFNLQTLHFESSKHLWCRLQQLLPETIGMDLLALKECLSVSQGCQFLPNVQNVGRGGGMGGRGQRLFEQCQKNAKLVQRGIPQQKDSMWISNAYISKVTKK